MPKNIFDINPAEVAAVAETRMAAATAVLDAFARRANGAITAQGLLGPRDEAPAPLPLPEVTSQRTQSGDPVAGPALQGKDLATDESTPVVHPKHLVTAMQFLRDREKFEADPQFDNFTKEGDKKYRIGYGDQIDFRTGKPVDVNTPPMSKEDAETALELRTKMFARVVEQNVKVPLTENQRAALISTAYNIGSVAFGNSSFVRKLNEGVPYSLILPDLKKFVYGRIKSKAAAKVAGLTKRRDQEYKLGSAEDTDEAPATPAQPE